MRGPRPQKTPFAVTPGTLSTYTVGLRFPASPSSLTAPWTSSLPSRAPPCPVQSQVAGPGAWLPSHQLLRAASWPSLRPGSPQTLRPKHQHWSYFPGWAGPSPLREPAVGKRQRARCSWKCPRVSSSLCGLVGIRAGKPGGQIWLSSRDTTLPAGTGGGRRGGRPSGVWALLAGRRWAHSQVGYARGS